LNAQSLAALPRFLEFLALTLSIYNVGVAWALAVVHYPTWRELTPERIGASARAHLTRMAMATTVPSMFAYMAVAMLVWVVPHPGTLFYAATAANLVNVLVVIWTLLIERPSLLRLARNINDPRALRRIVGGSFVLALGWTIESLIVLWIVLRV
jgi:hypothetical protein